MSLSVTVTQFSGGVNQYTNTSARGVANYLQWICGIYGLESQYIINGGGGGVVNPVYPKPFYAGYTVRAISASTTYTDTFGTFIILVDTSAGAITVTLPSSILSQAQFSVKKISSDSNNLIINSTSGNVDDGASATIKIQYASITLISGGSQWYII